MARPPARTRDRHGRFSAPPEYGVQLQLDAPFVSTDDPDVIQRVVEVVASRAASAVSISVLNCLVVSTPIDTGLAKASWIPSVGYVSSEVGGSKDAVSRDLQERGVQQLRSYVLAQGQIFISNNLPYIMRLNAGWSRQAPPGFIEIAIDEGLQRVGEVLGS